MRGEITVGEKRAGWTGDVVLLVAKDGDEDGDEDGDGVVDVVPRVPPSCGQIDAVPRKQKLLSVEMDRWPFTLATSSDTWIRWSG